MKGKFNPMKEIDRGCLCKRQFKTKEECDESIKRTNSKFPLRAYKCKFGDHWHKTKHNYYLNEEENLNTKGEQNGNSISETTNDSPGTHT